MAFDADSFRAARRPWSFTIHGRTFLARHVSAPQCQRFDDRLKEASADLTAQTRAVRWILRLAFPWRPSYLIRGDPVRIILTHLEPAARKEALNDFFACLRGTSPALPQSIQSPKTRNGTHSPGPTLLRKA